MSDYSEFSCNGLWDSISNPLITVVICVFNRRDTVRRAILSIDSQSFRDIELIVVDNGSTIPVDDIIKEVMNQLTIPALFIKRTYGMGPMTGRNTGILNARGRYIAFLDDDDIFLPSAMSDFVEEWAKVHKDKSVSYREVVGLCEDQNGNVIGKFFPDGINDLPWNEALKACNETGTAHMGLNRADVLKNNLFPEPEGVTMFDESLIWQKLSKNYMSWYFNKVVYSYYLNSSDSYCHTAKKRNPKQIAINCLYNNKYALEHWNEYDWNIIKRVYIVLLYNMYRHVLRIRFGGIPQYGWAQSHPIGLINALFRYVLYIPSYLIALYYVKRSI